MNILEGIFLTGLFLAGICFLFNGALLCCKPHKWYGLLILPQLLWLILGVKCAMGRSLSEWQLLIYEYPLLLLTIQIPVCYKLFSVWQKHRKENRKFLYLAISQIVSAVGLAVAWIILPILILNLCY